MEKSLTAEETVLIEVVDGVEGPSLYIDGNRACGPKPWGGGNVLHSFTVPKCEIAAAARRETLETCVAVVHRKCSTIGIIEFYATGQADMARDEIVATMRTAVLGSGEEG